MARPKRRIRPTLLRRNAPGEAIRLIAANKALEMKAKQMRGSGGNKQFYSRVRRELPGAVRKTERMIRGSGCYPVKAHRRCSGPRSGKSVKQKAPKKRTAKKSKSVTAAELKAAEALILKNMEKAGRKRGESLGSKFLDDLEKKYAAIEGVKLPSKSTPKASVSKGPAQNIQSLVRKKVRKGSGWSSWHHLTYL